MSRFADLLAIAIANWLARLRRVRLERRELRAMSDQQLRDIGLSGCDVRGLVDLPWRQERSRCRSWRG